MDPEKLAAMSTEELASARESASDDEKKAIDEEMAKRQSTEEKPEGETATKAGEGAVDAAQLPYGSQVLAAAYEAISTATADIKQAMQMVEQPDVDATLNGLIETLEGVRTQLSSTYSTVYPEAPSLEGAEEMTEATADENVLKSFVAMGRDRQTRGMGLIGRLQAALNMNPASKAAGEPAMKSLRSIMASAKANAVDFSPLVKEINAFNSVLK